MGKEKGCLAPKLSDIECVIHDEKNIDVFRSQVPSEPDQAPGVMI